METIRSMHSYPEQQPQEKVVTDVASARGQVAVFVKGEGFRCLAFRDKETHRRDWFK